MRETVASAVERTKRGAMTRQRLNRAVVYSLLACALAGVLTGVYAFLIEPGWIAMRELSLAGAPTVSIAHITDLHYSGDRALLEKVVARINRSSADLVCFTGDFVDGVAHLDEALAILAELEKPLYGVPGNHDYWGGAELQKIVDCFRSTGGDWLEDAVVILDDPAVEIVGSSGRGTVTAARVLAPIAGDGSSSERAKHILLVHVPATADRLENEQFDLILAGHSHGGQVRLPFVGALVLPYGVGRYVKGLFQTRSGPMFVSVGVGTFFLRVRFLCRPEIALIRI